MSANKHTEAVLLDFITDGDDTLNIVREGITHISAGLVSAGQITRKFTFVFDMDFRATLRKSLLEDNFMDFFKDFEFPDGREAGIEKFIDAIIKDMGIETETVN